MPVRDEESRLPESLGRLREYAAARGQTEVVLAIDAASKDGTAEMAERAAEQDGRVHVAHGDVSGKGATIASGLAACHGRTVLMADVDLAVDPIDFDRLHRAAASGALAIASRNVPDAQRLGEPLSRKVMGRSFNLAVRTLVLPGIRDSQCGYKAFPRAMGEVLFRELLTRRWVFDVELIARARVHGLPVVEIPVTWVYQSGSRLRPIADLPEIVRELTRVRRAYGRVRVPSQDPATRIVTSGSAGTPKRDRTPT